MKETKHQTLSCIASCTFSRIQKRALFSTWLCLNFANEIKFKFYCLMTLNFFKVRYLLFIHLDWEREDLPALCLVGSWTRRILKVLYSINDSRNLWIKLLPLQKLFPAILVGHMVSITIILQFFAIFNIFIFTILLRGKKVHYPYFIDSGLRYQNLNGFC